MRKVSMRIDYTLNHLPFAQQIQTAAAAGVDAVETGEVKYLDCRKAARIAADAGICFMACGCYDIWETRIGEPFEKIKGNFERSIECCLELGANKLLTLTIDSEDRGREAVLRFADRIRPAVSMCEQYGVTLILEPHSTKHVNPLVDMSKYFLNKSELAYSIMDELDSTNVKMLFDVYHCQSMEGDIFSNIETNLNYIDHFHIAGVPWRDEPMNGEINYKNLVDFVDELGYDQYYGLEYFPRDPQNLQGIFNSVAYIKYA